MSDISDLFARDPLSLTKEDLDAIIEHFRANRVLYLSQGTVAKEKKTPLAGASLADLGL